LIVDDSPEYGALLQRVFVKDGYDCLTTSIGADTVAVCIASAVDVVLLDVHLPDVDGFTVCRRLKSTPATSLIPVLMMTGDGANDSCLQALEAGADDFVSKPVAVPELRARVRSAVRMKAQTDDLDNAAATIVMLGATIEARDRSTEGHCQRIAAYATEFGQRLGVDAEGIRALRLGGFLHDLGKISIPDAVLFKSGRLTPAEFTLVQSHPVVGDRLCAPLRTLERVRPIIRHHHETLDGLGYPDRLRGSQIPLLAQITAIADVYDALTTNRPYRDALSMGAAFEILGKEAEDGKRDPALVQEFVRMCEETSAPTPAMRPAEAPERDHIGRSCEPWHELRTIAESNVLTIA
jgi:putative two-component system response regulator